MGAKGAPSGGDVVGLRHHRVMAAAPDSSTQSFVKIVGSDRAHLTTCGHLFGKEVVPAAGEQVCDLCQREIDGFGRTTFPDLDAALPAMGVSGTDWPAVKAALAGVAHDEVFMPYSRSYIALNRDGQGVAWVGKNYVDVAGGMRTELPGYASGPRGGPVTSEPRYGEVCGTCFMTKPVGGTHDCW